MNLAAARSKNYSPQQPRSEGVAVETPFTRARRERDALLGSSLVHVRQWRWAATAATALLAVSLLGNIFLATRATVVPHIVEVDSLGAPTYRGPVGRAVTPSEAVVRHELVHFIEMTRTVTSDLPLLRQRLVNVQKMLTTRGSALYEQWGSAENPTEQAKTRTTAVAIQSAVPLSKDTWQIDWQERAWDRAGNALGKPVLWRAMLQVVQFTPTTAKQMQDNPLGIYIDEFHWDRVEALRTP